MSEANFEGGHPGPEWLSAWHDGELHDEAATAVRQHLDGCAACRHLLDEYRQLDQATRLADDAAPDADAWDAIEGRLRQRLEDELGLGIPVGAATRYVETDADLVLRPSLAEVRGGKGARPFRLRWAFATAAGLGLGLLTLRTLSDNGWTVSGVMDPARDRRLDKPVAAAPPAGAPATGPQTESRQDEFAAAPAPASEPAPTNQNFAGPGPTLNAPPPASPAPVEVGAAKEAAAGAALGGGELKDLASDVAEERSLSTGEVGAEIPTAAAADRYLADVEAALRGRVSEERDGANDEAGLSNAAREPNGNAAAPSAAARSAYRSEEDASVKRKTGAAVDPGYAAVFAAASRARESGEYELARRGFDLVARAVPEQTLARDAEFEARLAMAHADIKGGRSPEVVHAELENEATRAWDAAHGGTVPECRRALALWRALGALDDEQGRSAARPDLDERVARLRSCAG